MRENVEICKEFIAYTVYLCCCVCVWKARAEENKKNGKFLVCRRATVAIFLLMCCINFTSIKIKEQNTTVNCEQKDDGFLSQLLVFCAQGITLTKTQSVKPLSSNGSHSTLLGNNFVSLRFVWSGKNASAYALLSSDCSKNREYFTGKRLKPYTFSMQSPAGFFTTFQAVFFFFFEFCKIYKSHSLNDPIKVS